MLLSERAYSTTVNGIEHMESESFAGIGMRRRPCLRGKKIDR